MVMKQQWIGFNVINKLENIITCKAINKLVFNTFKWQSIVAVTNEIN